MIAGPNSSIILYQDGGEGFLDALQMAALYFDKVYFFGLNMGSSASEKAAAWKREANKYDVGSLETPHRKIFRDFSHAIAN
jgi:hypothetical protein